MATEKFFLTVLIGLFYIGGQYIASQPQRISQETESKREITVAGSGEAMAKPDVARVTLSVQTGPQPDAKTALNLLSQKFNAVVAAVKSNGVKDNDVKTVNLSVHPMYDYVDGQQHLRGFEASESIEVKIRDLDKTGQVIVATTGAGVNQVGGIDFSIDDPDQLKIDAQEKAIKDADQKAKQLAKALGVSLGRVKTFSATTNDDVRPPMYASAALETKSSEPIAPPVPPGTQNITATVSVTYELR